MLNDWLRQEFKQRVSRKRKILMTIRLTEAFKKASIQVTPEEEKTENELIKAWPQFRIEIPKPVFPKFEPPGMPKINIQEILREAMENALRHSNDGDDTTET